MFARASGDLVAQSLYGMRSCGVEEYCSVGGLARDPLMGGVDMEDFMVYVGSSWSGDFIVPNLKCRVVNFPGTGTGSFLQLAELQGHPCIDCGSACI